MWPNPDLLVLQIFNVWVEPLVETEVLTSAHEIIIQVSLQQSYSAGHAVQPQSASCRYLAPLLHCSP